MPENLSITLFNMLLTSLLSISLSGQQLPTLFNTFLGLLSDFGLSTVLSMFTSAKKKQTNKHIIHMQFSVSPTLVFLYNNFLLLHNKHLTCSQWGCCKVSVGSAFKMPVYQDFVWLIPSKKTVHQFHGWVFKRCEKNPMDKGVRKKIRTQERDG